MHFEVDEEIDILPAGEGVKCPDPAHDGTVEYDVLSARLQGRPLQHRDGVADVEVDQRRHLVVGAVDAVDGGQLPPGGIVLNLGEHEEGRKEGQTTKRINILAMLPSEQASAHANLKEARTCAEISAGNLATNTFPNLSAPATVS